MCHKVPCYLFSAESSSITEASSSTDQSSVTGAAAQQKAKGEPQSQVYVKVKVDLQLKGLHAYFYTGDSVLVSLGKDISRLCSGESGRRHFATLFW